MSRNDHPNGTVYIVGAGASYAMCRFPLLGGFLRDCQDHIVECKELFLYLRRRFGDRESDGLDANLEDVLADLDNTLFGLGEVWYGSTSHPERLEAQIVRSQLLDVIQKRLVLDNGNGESSTRLRNDYKRVLGELTGCDAVITFNYDCSLQHASRLGPHRYVLNPSVNYLASEELANGEEPWLLHLHGSVDFIVCGNSKCPNRWRILGPRQPSGEGERICGSCGADMEIAIVPPSMTKSFQRYPLLSVLARIARERLAVANRIVIWGFSCPSTDHHVAWLLRSCRPGSVSGGNLKRIDVIDPNANQVLDRFKSLLAPGETVEYQCYRDHEEFIGG